MERGEREKVMGHGETPTEMSPWDQNRKKLTHVVYKKKSRNGGKPVRRGGELGKNQIQKRSWA